MFIIFYKFFSNKSIISELLGIYLFISWQFSIFFLLWTKGKKINLNLYSANVASLSSYLLTDFTFYSITFLHRRYTTGRSWVCPVLQFSNWGWARVIPGKLVPLACAQAHPSSCVGSEPSPRLTPGMHSGSLSSPGDEKACFILNRVDSY